MKYIYSILLSSVLLLWGTGTYATPTVSNIAPTSGSIGIYISVLGTNLNEVVTVYAPSSDGTPYSANFNTYADHLEVEISASNHAISGPLTLSGAFGTVTTPSYIITLSPAVLCSGASSIFGGGITMSTTPQTVTGIAGGHYYWSFTGVAGSTYRFSTCSSTDNTLLKLYDTGSDIGSNDDNGPVCTSSLAASLEMRLLVSGTYYILVTANNCNPLVSNTPMVFNSFTPTVPSVSSISPNSVPVFTTISIIGSGFTHVSQLNYKKTTGSGSATFTKFSNHLEFTLPNDAITGPLTLSGLFGNYPTPVLTVVGLTPTITGVSNLTEVPDYVTFTGQGFDDVTYCTFTKTGAGTNFTTDISKTSTSLVIFLPANAVSGTLTISGTFGKLVTPSVFIGSPVPTVTSIDPLTVSSGNFFTITGTDLFGVNNLWFATETGSKSTVIDVTSNYITGTVPTGAISGPLTLTGLFGSVETASITVVTLSTITGLSSGIDNTFEVYPNPGNGWLTVKSSEGIISIYNTLGSVTYSAATTGVKYVDGLLKGLYIVEFTSTTGFKSKKKLIVE